MNLLDESRILVKLPILSDCVDLLTQFSRFLENI